MACYVHSVLWGPQPDVLQPKPGESVSGPYRWHRVCVPVPLPHLLLHLLLHGEFPSLCVISQRSHWSPAHASMLRCNPNLGLLKPSQSLTGHGYLLSCLQVAGMVAIFQAQKRSMQADIDHYKEVLSTLHVRFPYIP
jgi:hypothetical protein